MSDLLSTFPDPAPGEIWGTDMNLSLAAKFGRYRTAFLADEADPSGVTNALAATQTMLDELAAAGGYSVVKMNGNFLFDGGTLTWPATVAPQAGGTYNSSVTLKNGAKFVLGNLTEDQRRPPVGGFSVIGGDASITEAMFIGISAASYYYDLRFYNITGICMNICALQNSLFENIDIATQNDIGMVFDLGCANLTMLNVHSSGRAGQEACTIIRQSGTTPPLIGVARPSKLHFIGGLHEGGCETAMKVTAGGQIDLMGVALNAATAASGVALKVDPQIGHQVSVRAHSTQFHAPTGTGIDVGLTGAVTLTGTCTFNDATHIKHSDQAIIRTDGTSDLRLAATGTPIVSTGTLPAGSVISVGGRRTITKSADESWTSDITYRDIAGFQFTVDINELYLVECDLEVEGATQPGAIQYRWRSGPTGIVTVKYKVEAPAYSATATSTSPGDRTWIPASVTPTTAAQRGTIGAGLPIGHRITAQVTGGASTATLFLQARQIAASATPTIIKAGSTMVVSTRTA